jgi:hypothetical protein
MFVISETPEEILFLTSNVFHMMQKRPAHRFCGSESFYTHNSGYLEGAHAVYFLYHNFITVKNCSKLMEHLINNLSSQKIRSFKKSWIEFSQKYFSMTFESLWIKQNMHSEWQHSRNSVKLIKKHMDMSLKVAPDNYSKKLKNKAGVSCYIGVSVNKITGESHKIFFNLKDIPGTKYVVECYGHPG